VSGVRRREFFCDCIWIAVALSDLLCSFGCEKCILNYGSTVHLAERWAFCNKFAAFMMG